MKTSLVSALLLPAALAAGCSSASGATTPLPPRDPGAPTAAVRLASPLPRLEGGTARATGELRSKLQATVSAKVSGTVLKVHVQPGDRVRRGDPLVELDPAILLIQLDQARAARKMAAAARANAQADLQRTRQLFEAGSAPPAILDKVSAGAEQADASHDQADAQVRLLEQSLRDHVLRAPFDGVVTARLKNVGDTLSMMPPTPVAALVSTAEVEVKLAVPEGLVGQLRPGAVLRGRTLPGGAAFEARVASVGTVVDPATRAVEVLADVANVPAAERAALRPGSLAEVDLGGVGAGEGPFVPAQAVVHEGERRFVWLVENGAARRRDIQVEPVTPQWVRIRAGLAGEQVVVEGVSGLADGMRVAVAK